MDPIILPSVEALLTTGFGEFRGGEGLGCPVHGILHANGFNFGITVHRRILDLTMDPGTRVMGELYWAGGLRSEY